MGLGRRIHRPSYVGPITVFALALAVSSAADFPSRGAEPSTDPQRYFAIEVIDANTRRGVPLVELTTVNHETFVTDSSGLIAIDEPELIGQSVFFHVRSHGYEFAKDGFGFRGKALDVKAGGHARLELKRINIAERLYRITGGGIYRDTVLLGRESPIREPLLAGQVVGCDSICSALYQGRIYWFWGDTQRPSYPLGNFHTTGATTATVGRPDGLDPDLGINFDYFTRKDGFVRPVAEVGGEGPTWIGGLTVLRDHAGSERMYASYVKIRPPLTPYEHGLVVWDDGAEKFKKLATFPAGAAINLEPQFHTFQHSEADGKRYVYFSGPLPWIRVPADEESLTDPTRFEGFSCLKEGTRFDQRQLDRDEHGRLRYDWKRATAPVNAKQQGELIKAGLMKPGESLATLRDVETGRAVTPHKGSVYWNDYRRRWVMIVCEIGGESSHLGEVWFAEADSPEGPWLYARKMVTHDRYSFYNPKHHPLFDRRGGQIIYFEGTYTRDFSGNPIATPRYEYNQMMYKVDLSDERLNLPTPVYDASQVENGGRRIAFFALSRGTPASLPVYATRDEQGLRYSLTANEADVQPVFYALPVDAKDAPRATVELFEFVSEEGLRRRYSTAHELAGYHRAEEPMCRVWPDPIEAAVDWRVKTGE